MDLLEATALDEGALGLKVGGKDFSELSANIGEDVVGSELKEGLKGGKVSAHLDDVGFLLIVDVAFWRWC